MTAAHQEFGPKFVAEVVRLPFDFTGDLAVGETISTAVCSVAVYSGVDVSPSSLLSGTATIDASEVTQLFQAGIAGVIYTLTCQVTTSASQTLVRVGLLAVVENAP